MSDNKRFEKIYSQGVANVSEIWVDQETGVNYFYHASGYSGGLTVLLDREGKPVIYDTKRFRSDRVAYGNHVIGWMDFVTEPGETIEVKVAVKEYEREKARHHD